MTENSNENINAVKDILSLANPIADKTKKCEPVNTWVECARPGCDCGKCIYKITWCKYCLGIIAVDDSGLKKDLMETYEEIVTAHKPPKAKGIDLITVYGILNLKPIRTTPMNG